MGYSTIKTDMSKDADASPEAIKRNEDLSLCFWLGFLLPIYGLIISAIILKGDGVRKAIGGLLLSFFLYFIVGILFMLNYAFSMTQTTY